MIMASSSDLNARDEKSSVRGLSKIPLLPTIEVKCTETADFVGG